MVTPRRNFNDGNRKCMELLSSRSLHVWHRVSPHDAARSVSVGSWGIEVRRCIFVKCDDKKTACFKCSDIYVSSIPGSSVQQRTARRVVGRKTSIQRFPCISVPSWPACRSEQQGRKHRIRGYDDAAQHASWLYWAWPWRAMGIAVVVVVLGTGGSTAHRIGMCGTAVFELVLYN